MLDLDSPLSAEQRVANGAAWFDERGPSDWRTRIDPDALDVESEYDCPLGQVYGSYFGAPYDARFSEDSPYAYMAVERGFNGQGTDLEALNAAWRALIAARR